MNKHKQIKLAFKIVGFVCLGVGLILVLIGFVLLEKYSGTYDPLPLFWFDLIGIPLIGIGVGALRYGFKRGVMEYIEKEMTQALRYFIASSILWEFHRPLPPHDPPVYPNTDEFSPSLLNTFG